MKVKLVCGFFGSGKTTLLKNILKISDKKTVVLINELGDVAIDGDMISQVGNLEIIELPSGCICCILKADLITTVEQIYIELKPERLIIEPSGIATPSNILEALQMSRVFKSLEIETVVGIIDATIFLEYYESGDFDNFFMDQVMNSDILLINKCDLVSKEVAKRTEDKIKELNKSAITYLTEYCRAPISSNKRHKETTHFHFDADLDSISLQTKEIFDEKNLKEFFHNLHSEVYGEIIRAKGIFKTKSGFLNLDYVPKNTEFRKLEKGKVSKFVAIGKNLNKTLIREKLFS